MSSREEILWGPGGWRLCMAMHAATLSASWIFAVSPAQVTPSFMSLYHFHLSPWWWSSFMMTYCVVSTWTVFWGSSMARSAMSIVGAIVWGALGTLYVLGGLYQSTPPFLSAIGLFELGGAAGCCASVVQWSRMRAGT